MQQNRYPCPNCKRDGRIWKRRGYVVFQCRCGMEETDTCGVSLRRRLDRIRKDILRRKIEQIVQVM
jgi:ribosomal protein L37AE/L43A